MKRKGCRAVETKEGMHYYDHTYVFFRDRVAPIWPLVREHIYSLIVNGTEKTFMVERAVVGLLRIAVRLLRREEMASQVLNSLQILLMMKPKVIHSISQQISFGLHDLLRTNAANIHSEQDWYTLFVLLEVVGAGANPPPLLQVNSGVDITEGLKDAGRCIYHVLILYQITKFWICPLTE